MVVFGIPDVNWIDTALVHSALQSALLSTLYGTGDFEWWSAQHHEQPPASEPEIAALYLPINSWKTLQSADNGFIANFSSSKSTMTSRFSQCTDQLLIVENLYVCVTSDDLVFSSISLVYPIPTISCKNMITVRISHLIKRFVKHIYILSTYKAISCIINFLAQNAQKTQMPEIMVPNHGYFTYTGGINS